MHTILIAIKYSSSIFSFSFLSSSHLTGFFSSLFWLSSFILVHVRDSYQECHYITYYRSSSIKNVFISSFCCGFVQNFVFYWNLWKQNTFEIQSRGVCKEFVSCHWITRKMQCARLLYHEKPTVAYSSYARIDLRRYKARTTFVGEPLIGEVGQLNVNWRYIRYMHEHLRILNQSSLFIVKTRNWWNINQWLITL